jgi:hypothetical protein
MNEFIIAMFGGKIAYKDIILKDRLKFIFPEERDVLDSHLGSEVS